MASWFGVGLANAVGTGLNTYRNLRRIQDEDKIRADEAQAEALYKEQAARIGGQDPNAAWQNVQAPEQGDFGPGEARMVDTPVQTQRKFTQVDADREYALALGKAGLNKHARAARRDARESELGELQIASGQRTERKGVKQDAIDEKEEAIYSKYMNLMKDPEQARANFFQTYNNPRKGASHDDGHQTYGKIVVGPDGKPQEVAVFYDAKTNKVVNEIPMTQENLYLASRAAMMDELKNLSPAHAGKADKFYETRFTQRMKEAELAISGRNAAVAEGRLAIEQGSAPHQRRSWDANAAQSYAAARGANDQTDSRQRADKLIPQIQAAQANFDAVANDPNATPAQIAGARNTLNSKIVEHAAIQRKDLQLRQDPSGAGGAGGRADYELKPMTSQEGGTQGFMAHDKKTGGVVGWVSPTGRELESGYTEERASKMDKKAAEFPGVRFGAMKGKNGKFVMAFINDNGEGYTTPQEAAAAMSRPRIDPRDIHPNRAR